MTTTSKFAASITTNPSHFGHDPRGRNYSDDEILGTEPDVQGTMDHVYSRIVSEKTKLGGTYHRVVVKNLTSGEFVKWDNFRADWQMRQYERSVK
jgi:hypothetical protein